MANEVVYEIRAKNASGKWWGYGRVTKNQYGNLQVGMKKNADLVALFESVPEGGWLNLSLFEPRDQQEPRSAAAKSVPREPELDDEIPF
jgi:hypothetical protein